MKLHVEESQPEEMASHNGRDSHGRNAHGTTARGCGLWAVGCGLPLLCIFLLRVRSQRIAPNFLAHFPRRSVRINLSPILFQKVMRRQEIRLL